MHVCLNKAAATMVYSLRAFFLSHALVPAKC